MDVVPSPHLTKDQFSSISAFEVLQALPDAAALLDLSGVVICCNAASERIWGWAAATCAGEPLAHRLSLSSQHLLMEAWRAMAVGQEWRGIFTAGEEQGEQTSAEVTLRPLTNHRGDWHGVLCLFLPLASATASVLSSTPEETARCELNWTKILEHAADGYQLISSDLRYLFLNVVAASQFLRPRMELSGQRLVDVFPEFNGSAFAQALNKCASSQKNGMYEHVVSQPDGSHRYYDFSIQPVAEGLLIHSREVTSRRRIEQQRRQSETRSKLFAGHSLETILLLGPDGRIEDVNSAACRNLGYSRGELIGEFPLMFDEGLTAASLTEVLCRDHGGKYLQLETQYRRKDGLSLSVLLHLHTFSVNRRMLTMVVAKNITELKAAESLIRQQHELLDETQHLAQLGSFEWNLTANRLVWSDEMYRILGHGPGQFEARYADLLDAVIESDRADLQASLNAVSQGASERRLEFSILRPDGSRRILEFRARSIVNALGKPIRVVGCCRDMTEQRQADADLRESERRFRGLADTIPQIVWSCSADGQVKHLNARAVEYFSGNGNAFDSQHLMATVHPEDRPVAEANWNPAFHTGQPADCEVRLRRHDGVYRWHISRQRPIRDAQGVVIEWFGTCTDIEEHKRTESLLASQNKLLTKIASGVPVKQVLYELLEQIEAMIPGAMGSIMLMGRDQRQLFSMPAPTLSPDYLRDVDGVEIDPDTGSCGQAAATRSVVIVSDIATHPLWRNFRDLALKYGLRACWSVPILSMSDAHQDILGTFAVYYRDIAEPDESALNAVLQMTHIAQVVLERERVIRDLRESESRFRNVLDHFPAMVFVCDSGSRFKFVNRRMADAYEIPQNNWMGRTSADLLPGKLAELLEQSSEHVQREGKVLECIQSISLPGPVSMTTASIYFPLIDSDGQGKSVCGILIDLTARQQAEKSRQESDEKFRTLAENFPDPIFVLSPETDDAPYRILYVNQAFYRLHGFPSHQVIGHSIHTFVKSPRHDDTVTLAEALLEGMVEFQGTLLTANGDEVPLEIRYGMIPWEGQEAILGIGRDVAAQRTMEEQLRHSQKMQAIGQLAGGLAHDFNNVLSVILGYGRRLQMQMPADHSWQNPVREMISAAHSASDLVRHLLAFSRKQRMELSLLDLHELILRIETLFRGVLGDAVELRLALNAKCHHIYADHGQIEQVLLNLVINARDAMTAEGELSIETADEDGMIENLGEKLRKPVIRLTVRDTGNGIAEEHLPKIFEPFFTTKPVGEGTGLGLSTVYGIVQQSGGTIQVDSQLGQGTLFHLRFPCSNAPVAKTSPPLPVATPQITETPRGTILLVEDFEQLRALSSSILRRRGYQVLEAPDGHAALELLENHAGTIDLLITDVLMPRMSGVTLCSTLRESLPWLPVILLSGYSEQMPSSLVHTGIPTVFLQKPVEPAQLLQSVQDMLKSVSRPSSSA